MFTAYLSGIGIGASLIIAIGAQNAFVLVQGVRRNHHFLVGGICALCDVMLIAAGALGLGGIIASHPVLRFIAGAGGCLFLVWFGARSLKQAMRGQSLELHGQNGSDGVRGLKATVLATLAVTLLNPHVYLDTVVMLGAISSGYPGSERFVFALGACTASVCWFFALAQAGRMLAPVFAKPAAWRVLHVVVALVVWLVAVQVGAEAVSAFKAF